MIKANFSTYHNYTVDSLYQWDLNQKLTLAGLNIAVAPEVHFSNANMERAIVRQATMTDHVITVDIPNSLLQSPLRIYAHIGIYDGDTFKVIEVVEIPVIARKKPADYQIENSDDEIYSFKALEYLLSNSLTKAEGQTINARIDTIIANANNTEGNSELVDIRVGLTGETYASAGAAVRSQFKNMNDNKANKIDIAMLKSIVKCDFQFLNYDEQTSGEYWNGKIIGTASGYYRYPVVKNVPAGEYYWSNLLPNFTYLENVNTGELSKLADVTDGELLSVDFEFNLYATNSYVESKPTFSTSYLAKEYVFGAYNIEYKGLVDDTPVFYCGAGEEFATLKEAIEYATQFMDATLYVKKGTYDLIEEFGASYFANYTTADGVGLVLKNRIHVIFEQGAKVICHYTGTNTDVQTYFSPFNSGEYGFTLENAWVESSNVRYTVHDERASAEIPYKNIYKRCTFKHDSSGTSWGPHQALGGGLGRWGDISIEDCFMTSVGANEVLTFHNAGYENTNLTEFASNIVIRGCYIDGTIRVNATGYSTLITNIYVSGNSLLSEVLSGKTTEDATDNVKLYAWNNEIRS